MRKASRALATVIVPVVFLAATSLPASADDEGELGAAVRRANAVPMHDSITLSLPFVLPLRDSTDYIEPGTPRSGTDIRALAGDLGTAVTCSVTLHIGGVYSKPADGLTTFEGATAWFGQPSPECPAHTQVWTRTQIIDSGATPLSSTHASPPRTSSTTGYSAETHQDVSVFSLPTDVHGVGSRLTYRYEGLLTVGELSRRACVLVSAIQGVTKMTASMTDCAPAE